MKSIESLGVQTVNMMHYALEFPCSTVKGQVIASIHKTVEIPKDSTCAKHPQLRPKNHEDQTLRCRPFEPSILDSSRGNKLRGIQFAKAAT
jgi:hypothetical protein